MSLNIAYWNIHGHKSTCIGDKLCDPEFLNLVKEADVLGIGELHAESEVSVPGFINVKQKIRTKNFRGPKIAGGIAVFVREEVNHLVQVMENKNEDSIWIKVKKETFNGKNDTLIGTYYVSPDHSSKKKNNKKSTDFLSAMLDEISFFSKKGPLLLQGDFNSRTGVETDFIGFDKSDVELGIDNLDNQNPRNSEDKSLNNRGRDLLDVCKLNDLLILNGRKTGDIFGRYTSHNWNGSSVVDYAIASNSIMNSITTFSVGNFIPWLSDHCLIKTIIDFGDVSLRKEIEQMNPKDLHPGWVWNEADREIFTENLTLSYFKEKFEALEESTDLTPTELAKEIKILLLENVKTSKIRQKKIANSDSDPWFDSECKRKKENIGRLGNKIKRSPTDQSLRMELSGVKKEFKRTVLQKKRRYKDKMFSILESKREDGTPKEFWNIFKKISPKCKKDSVQPSMKKFFDYFKTLSKSSRALTVPPLSLVEGPLDYEIIDEELEFAAKKLKFGKASGYDNNCNEMIMALIKTYPKILLKLFNDIMQSSEVIPEWALGMIVPIYKDGPKLDTANYRGITLISCLGKLFLSILNNRLSAFAVENNLLSPAQLGFVPKNRCSDAHIIIHNLIKQKCHQRNLKVYSCFVDFKKAFDSVPRDLLLSKLLKLGVNGKFFNILRHIYTTDKACIKMGQSRSDFFDLDIGVRQGCVLSPLLFNLFLCDLAKQFDAMEDKPMLGNRGINSLFWADDLVLFSESKEGLDRLLKTLEEYCKENDLLINTKKTKCMIFNKTGRLLRRPFYLNGVKLEMVREYKYLGFILTPSGEISTGLKDLRNRAFKAFMKMKNDLGRSFNQDIPMVLNLIDFLIKPILLYASDFWGCLKLPRNNPVENLHMMMCKQLIGVQKQTTNSGVLLELGRIPLNILAAKHALKNWERIRLGSGNDLLIDVYKEGYECWDLSIKHLLEVNGMLNFYVETPPLEYPFIFKKIYQRLYDNFHETTFGDINQNSSKLRTYALFKTEPGFEKYLTEIKNTTVRQHVTKFRLSNHRLAIETGRHEGKNLEERRCFFCPDKIEDEAHFLFECPVSRFLRDMYVTPIVRNVPGFEFFPVHFKLKALMSQMNPELCKFISSATDLRNFLISKPRIYD